MTYLKISKRTLAETIVLPPSKSHTMRALIFGAMADGITTIHHFLDSPDTWAMVKGLQNFGVEIDTLGASLKIKGVNGKLGAPTQIIDAGNSGQVLRFLGALAALLPTNTYLTGDLNRPTEPLLSALRQLNAHAEKTQTVHICGPMSSGRAELCGIDSQPVSALLMACSFLKGTTHIHVNNPGEKPWIDLTLSWLKRFGAQIIHQNYEDYTICGPLSFKGFETTIPGDFSSAAFPIAAALITHSSLTLENCDMDDVQGDKNIIPLLIAMGAEIEIISTRKCLKIHKTSSLKGMNIDVNPFIDAVPILAVLGCFAKGKTEIFNAAIARKKESDRLKTMTLELKKMGAIIEEKEDGLIIHPSPLSCAHLHAHADHRVAMSLIVAALGAKGETLIEGVECIDKSYPYFIKKLFAEKIKIC